MFTGLDFWGDCECAVVDLDGKTLAREEDTNPRELFKSSWARVEREWAKNPRPLTIELRIGGRVGQGTTLTVCTAANGRGPGARCECPTCGWDDAHLYERQLVLADDLGLLFESPVEWLVADGPHKIFAMWREIECTMCTELDAAGLDRVTKRPLVPDRIAF
jgi:hypothetical protein